MLEQLKYRNHLNEVFDFGHDGIFVNMNELHDYEWKVKSRNNRVASLTYPIVNRKLPVVIMCDTEEQGIAARNRLLEVCEKDVLALKHGMVIIGDYYFRCFVTRSQKKEYSTSKRYMQVTLTLTSDFPFWVKESVCIFRKKVDQTGEGNKYFDFNYDYPIDYYSNVNSDTLHNTGFVDTNFRMVIYGPCSNPGVYISNHLYQVNCNVGDREYLTIDSVTKRIYLTANDGAETNVFNLRNRESYIFKKIPPQSNPVRWEGEFGVDVILLEERSEPKWT